MFVLLIVDFNNENLTHINDDDTRGSHGKQTFLLLIAICGFADLLKEVLMHQEQPSSPKWTRSPLKKFNKVAPLNVTDKNTTVELKPSLDSPLLTTARSIVTDTNDTLDNDDNDDDNDDTVNVIANHNADSNVVTFQIESSTS